MNLERASTLPYVLAAYAAFALVAAGIGLAADRRRAGDVAGRGTSTRRKLPTYVALNLAILAAILAPAAWQLFPALLVALAAGLAAELAAALGMPARTCLGFALLAGALVALAVPVPGPSAFAPLWLAVSLIALVATSLTTSSVALGRRLLALVGAAVYVPGCLVAWLWLWSRGPGGGLAPFLYLTVAAHDAYAQVIGQALGRTPLSPRISPAKTVEGAVGGLVAAAGMGALLAVTVALGPATGAALGMACGAAAAVGDLMASAWKRALGLRTFGRALGPHGGLLDRFDGLLAAAAVLYLLAFVSTH